MMTAARVLLGLALALGFGAAPLRAQEQTPPDAERANEVEGVTVTARRPAPTIAKSGPSDPDPFEFFRDYCFDPNRLQRRSARPVGDPDWRPLSAEKRAQLRISDPSTVTYGRLDRERGLALVLRVEQGPMPSEVRNDLIQHRCSLTVKGPAAPDEFRRSISALFNGGGTQDHVDHPSAPGYASMPGWRQYLWSAIPTRGSSRWEVFRSGGLIFVSAPSFYRRCDYVAGELRHTKDPAAPVSILLLTHTFARASAADPVNNKPPCR